MNAHDDPFGYEPEERAKDLRAFATWAEKLMWSWLRNRRLGGYKFRRQHPFGECVLDFFCDEAMLSIELDGAQHGKPEERQRDEARTKFLALCGVKELRFWNGQLKRNPEMVRATIFRELQARAPKPLPDYTKPMTAPASPLTLSGERAGVRERGAKELSAPRNTSRPRPHPNPLPRGEGTGGCGNSGDS